MSWASWEGSDKQRRVVGHLNGVAALVMGGWTMAMPSTLLGEGPGWYLRTVLVDSICAQHSTG